MQYCTVCQQAIASIVIMDLSDGTVTGSQQVCQACAKRLGFDFPKSPNPWPPSATVAKLIAQAQADQPKAQRLLALGSLAVLAAPEALPYLIDHTEDGDAEIAAAAREAIARIHAKAGTPPPDGDKK
jgi:HEAT repeat protein